MSSAAIVGLGAIAGFTIFLGLPIGRVRNASAPLRATLNAIATGILVFLFWDVLSHAIEPVEDALVAAAVEHSGGWARFAGLTAVFTIGLAIGLVSLVYYDQWMARQTSGRHGPGAMSVAERPSRGAIGVADPARRLALLIAVGIGLHNLAEGLAIGQSAAAGELSLAILLIIGFGLHNATEGFGIVGPLAGGAEPPELGSSRRARPHRRRADLPRHRDRPVLRQRHRLSGFPRARGRLDSLRRRSVAPGRLQIRPHPSVYWGMLAGLLLGLATDFIIDAAGA